MAKYSRAQVEGPDRPIVYLNLPLEKFYPHVGALIQQAKSRGEVYCIILDHYPDLIAAALRAIVQAGPGGVLFHCHSGTDRTGMIAALLLGLAGVPSDTVCADYAESRTRWKPLDVKRKAEAGKDASGDFWQPATATAQMMDQMLAHVDRKYGGVEQYLRGAGLALEEISQLKFRLGGVEYPC